ncbi:hypothetical protein Dimus_000418 [Dionaea muscipula]
MSISLIRSSLATFGNTTFPPLVSQLEAIRRWNWISRNISSILLNISHIRYVSSIYISNISGVNMDGQEVEPNKSTNYQIVPKVRVLLVDDDCSCRAVIGGWLRKWKYHVVAVANALDALNTLHAERGSFDIVVTDVHMPSMNGLELLEHVRREYYLPVILISADEEEVTKIKGAQGGALDYILKSEFPFSWERGVATGERRRGEVVIDAQLTWVPEEEDSINEPIRNESGEASQDSKDGEVNDKPPKKQKLCWTPELHRKFEKAIDYLGFDKAVPKKIVELMDEPGVTRAQVASHLQKFRLHKKRRAMEKGDYSQDVLLAASRHIEDRRLSSMLIRIGILPRDLQLPGVQQTGVLHQPGRENSPLVQNLPIIGVDDVLGNGFPLNGGNAEVMGATQVETGNPPPPFSDDDLLLPSLLGSEKSDETSAAQFTNLSQQEENNSRIPPLQNENPPEYFFGDDWWNGVQDSSCLIDLINNAALSDEHLPSQNMADLPNQVDDNFLWSSLP